MATKKTTISKNRSYLQQKLQEKMSAMSISAHALEKQAGLKPSAVQNIIHGRSKKPSAEILFAVAKILGCQPDELIGKNEHFLSGMPIHNSTSHAQSELNFELYSQAVTISAEIFKTRTIATPKQKAIQFIEEIYAYSIENALETIDNRFATWLANKWWKN